MTAATPRPASPTAPPSVPEPAPGPGLDAAIARHATHRRLGPAARAWLARPFSGRGRRLCLLYHPIRISFAQIHPFLFHARALRARYGVEIRCLPVDRLLEGGAAAVPRADRYLVQPWFRVEGERLERGLAGLRDRDPEASLGFIDSFAPNDLRLARHAEPYVDVYAKKSLFRDRARHLQAFHGDTNLADHYGALFGLEQEVVDWRVPPAILDRLRLTPNFFTSPVLLPGFARGGPPAEGPRDIDLHARLGVRGSPVYESMRGLAASRVEALDGISRATGGGLSHAAFMAELGRARLCFSPFGYGELCWRDIEAFLTGAVLVKPDMSHLDTLPDLYVPGETYLPVAWDFSDLEEVVREALADPERLRRIALEAWSRVARYVREERFVEDAAPLVAPSAEAAAAPAG